MEICRDCWKERHEISKFASFKSNATKVSIAQQIREIIIHVRMMGGQIFALTSQTSAGTFCDLAEQYLQPS